MHTFLDKKLLKEFVQSNFVRLATLKCHISGEDGYFDRDHGAGRTNIALLCWQILKIISSYLAEREAEIGTVKARGGGVLSIFVRRGCAVFQGIVFAHFF